MTEAEITAIFPAVVPFVLLLSGRPPTLTEGPDGQHDPGVPAQYHMSLNDGKQKAISQKEPAAHNSNLREKQSQYCIRERIWECLEFCI